MSNKLSYSQRVKNMQALVETIESLPERSDWNRGKDKIAITSVDGTLFEIDRLIKYRSGSSSFTITKVDKQYSVNQSMNFNTDEIGKTFFVAYTVDMMDQKTNWKFRIEDFDLDTMEYVTGRVFIEEYKIEKEQDDVKVIAE